MKVLVAGNSLMALRIVDALMHRHQVVCLQSADSSAWKTDQLNANVVIGELTSPHSLRDAGAESVFYDTRQKTLIVLGDKGRAHVFNDAGKLVTSIRYSPESIAKRKKIGRWRPATPEEIAALRADAR